MTFINKGFGCAVFALALENKFIAQTVCAIAAKSLSIADTSAVVPPSGCFGAPGPIAAFIAVGADNRRVLRTLHLRIRRVVISRKI